MDKEEEKNSRLRIYNKLKVKGLVALFPGKEEHCASRLFREAPDKDANIMANPIGIPKTIYIIDRYYLMDEAPKEANAYVLGDFFSACPGYVFPIQFYKLVE